MRFLTDDYSEKLIKAGFFAEICDKQPIISKAFIGGLLNGKKRGQQFLNMGIQ